MAKDTSPDYSDVVAGLKARRALLVRAIEGFDMAIEALSQLGSVTVAALAPAGPATAPKAKAPSSLGIRPDTFFRMTVLDAAKKYLSMGHEPKTIPDIADALNAGGLQCKAESVATIISKAARARVIEKIGSGTWGLPEWYTERKENGGNP